MIECRVKLRLRSLLRHNPAVALLGPRQCGKTTLALEAARELRSVYLDLETLRRFCTMLAHDQAQVLNAANLARGLAAFTLPVNRK